MLVFWVFFEVAVAPEVGLVSFSTRLSPVDALPCILCAFCILQQLPHLLQLSREAFLLPLLKFCLLLQTLGKEGLINSIFSHAYSYIGRVILGDGCCFKDIDLGLVISEDADKRH